MKQSLNFNWSFIFDFKKEYLTSMPENSLKVNIPHVVKEVPYNYFDEKCYQGVSTYEKIFDVDHFDKDKTYLLNFGAFMLQADIYLNNVLLGHFVSLYNPISIDVSKFIKEKDNRLVVVLDSKEDPLLPPFGYAVDYLTFGGIYREVELEILPKSYIKNIYVHGDISGKTQVYFDKVGTITNFKYQVLEDDMVLFESNGKGFTIERPRLWSLRDPYLYTMRIFADDEIYEVKYGYRDVKFKRDGFYLNREKVKLIGLNRHQLYPFVGPAMPKSMQEDDAIKLKELGVNIIRTSHYPQSEHFLNKCDELGLLVIDEIPGWQHIGKEDRWREQYYENVSSMVLKERNHPCLVAYGVRIDESMDDHDLYSKGNKLAHNLDPYRMTIGVRNVPNSELLEDIYGYNDFTCSDLKVGLKNPKKVTKEKAPILITEYMGHMRPNKPTSDIELQRHVALRHARVIDDCFKYDTLSGCIGWCFVDYYTHVDFGTGDHICYHGVMDMYRNKKLSASTYEAQQDIVPVMEILSNLRPGDYQEATYQDIYINTNCDYVLLYKNEELVGSFVPDKKHYKYMKHPPIYIDDIMGQTFNDDRFNEKERKNIAKIFSYAGIYGFGHLPLNYKLKMSMIALKHHLNWDQIMEIWNKHISSWGGKALSFTFKGIKNNKSVIEKSVYPSLSFHYEVNTPRKELIIGDTYDVLPIQVRFLDQNNTLMNYASRVIEVSTSGPIEIIGGNTHSLLNGQITLYVRSSDIKGKAKVTIKTDLGNIEVPLTVK